MEFAVIEILEPGTVKLQSWQQWTYEIKNNSQS